MEIRKFRVDVVIKVIVGIVGRVIVLDNEVGYYLMEGFIIEEIGLGKIYDIGY